MARASAAVIAAALAGACCVHEAAGALVPIDVGFSNPHLSDYIGVADSYSPMHSIKTYKINTYVPPPTPVPAPPGATPHHLGAFAYVDGASDTSATEYALDGVARSLSNEECTMLAAQMVTTQGSVDEYTKDDIPTHYNAFQTLYFSVNGSPLRPAAPDGSCDANACVGTSCAAGRAAAPSGSFMGNDVQFNSTCATTGSLPDGLKASIRYHVSLAQNREGQPAGIENLDTAVLTAELLLETTGVGASDITVRVGGRQFVNDNSPRYAHFRSADGSLFDATSVPSDVNWFGVRAENDESPMTLTFLQAGSDCTPAVAVEVENVQVEPADCFSGTECGCTAADDELVNWYADYQPFTMAATETLAITVVQQLFKPNSAVGTSGGVDGEPQYMRESDDQTVAGTHTEAALAQADRYYRPPSTGVHDAWFEYLWEDVYRLFPGNLDNIANWCDLAAELYQRFEPTN